MASQVCTCPVPSGYRCPVHGPHEAGLAEPAPVAGDDSTTRYMFDLASVTREQDGTFTLRAPAESGRTICGATRDTALGVIAARWGSVPACTAPVAGVSAEERARWAEMAEAMPAYQDVRHHNTVRWVRAAEAFREAVPRLLAALTAAEERAAQAEREREDMRAERDAARFSLRQFEAAFATEQVRADDAERAAEALAAQIVETKQTLFERTGEEP